MTLFIEDLTPVQSQYYLQHIVAPRPICLASTIDTSGAVNLSAFSFFNLFSANPPVVIFSPARRLRDNTVKHSLENVLEVPEVSISVVSPSMVQQVSLASNEYAKGVNEFEKSGLTPKPASLIRPPLVAESPASMECRVLEVKSLGEKGGAGQLVIAEVICAHIDDAFVTGEGRLSPEKMEFAARLGGDWYASITGQNMFRVRKPGPALAIGIDALPAYIRTSAVLTGSHLAQLAALQEIPEKEGDFYDGRLDALTYYFKNGQRLARLHEYAKELIDEGKIHKAWQVLLACADCMEKRKTTDM